MEDPRTICRTCGANEPKRSEGEYLFADWEVALPDNLEGAVLLDNTGVWCSQECRENDPSWKPFQGGENMFDAYNRFGEAHGIDLIGAFAKSRGVSPTEAREALHKGFGRGLKAMRKAGRQ